MTRYQNNKLTEVILEFGVPVSSAVPLTEQSLQALAGRLRARLNGQIERLEILSQVSLPIPPAGQPVVERQHRVRVWSADRRRLMQFGPELCAFNAMQPYTCFEDYLDDAHFLFEQYTEMRRPASVGFFGQRRINAFDLPASESPADYFSLYPTGVSQRAGPRHVPFQLHVAVATFPTGQVTVGMVYMGEATPGGQHRYLLDLYARSSEPVAIRWDWQAALGWQEEARKVINDIFSQAITLRTKEMIGPGEP